MNIYKVIENKDIDKLRRMIGYGSDLSTPFSSDPPDNPLSFACRVGFAEGVKLLLERGANVHERGKYDRTALHDAVRHPSQHPAYLTMVCLLCDYGADIHAVAGTDHSTALHFAAEYGQLEICKELVKRGANIRKTDVHWRTPYQYSFTDTPPYSLC